MTAVTAITATRRGRWWRALTVALAAGYVVTGALSPSPEIRWPFLSAALVVVGALAAVSRSRPVAWTLLVVGALIPVATTWWSVVTPVTALLILGCGTAAIRATGTPATSATPGSPRVLRQSQRR